MKRHLLHVLFAFISVSLAAGCSDDTSDPGASGSEDTGVVDLGADATVTVDVVEEPFVAEFQITPVFSTGGGFMDLPWPLDSRVTADGHPVLTGFTSNNSAFLRRYVDLIEEEVVGFGTMPVVYFRLDRNPGQLPPPSQSTDELGAVQLFDVSPGHCGERIPVELQFRPTGDDFRGDNTLAVSPVPGFVLKPLRTYAVVLTERLGRDGGGETVRVASFDGILDGTHADAALVAAYAPLRDCLAQGILDADRIAVATVFTTQDPTAELRRMRNFVANPDTMPAPTVASLTVVDEASRASDTTWEGTYSTPIFQTGQTPYTATGGNIEFEDNGHPILQRWEDVPFVITVPTAGSGPYPVLIWSDGTGAELYHHIAGSPVRDAVSAGFAIATFQPQFHGNRSGTADPEIATFNFLNAAALRNNFRQQVVDTAYFIRVIREVLASHSSLPALDTSRLVYGGHSQGAIVGAITAGVETEIVAYALNGIGGYLAATIVGRKDPIDIAEQLQTVLGIDGTLDRFHPVVALAQLGGEVADPINYAPHWRGWDAHPEGQSIFLSNGRQDHTTPEMSINSVTIAGDVTPVRPPGWSVDPFLVWDVIPQDAPISGNTRGAAGEALTIATVLTSTTGHYTIYDVAEVRGQFMYFLDSAARGTPEVIE